MAFRLLLNCCSSHTAFHIFCKLVQWYAFVHTHTHLCKFIYRINSQSRIVTSKGVWILNVDRYCQIPLQKCYRNVFYTQQFSPQALMSFKLQQLEFCLVVFRILLLKHCFLGLLAYSNKRAEARRWNEIGQRKPRRTGSDPRTESGTDQGAGLRQGRLGWQCVDQGTRSSDKMEVCRASFESSDTGLQTQ